MPGVAHRGRGRRAVNEINMVPFIDVMLVLLIIFMVTAPMITPSLIDLPSVGKANRQPDQKIEIVIAKDETLEMKLDERNQRLTLAEVAAAVQRVHPRIREGVLRQVYDDLMPAAQQTQRHVATHPARADNPDLQFLFLP